MSPVTVRSLTLSRYYLTLAKEHARSDREADAFVAINLLHEAIETFLVAAAEHLNVPVKARTEFVTYLDKLDEALAPRRMPFRILLNRLNKARVQAKHDSVVPDRAEIPNFVAGAGSFLEEATETVFELNFGSISLVDLIQLGEIKDHLLNAQAAFDGGEHAEVLIECRKALYMVFEKRFDISGFAANNAANNAFLAFLCQAPAYARSQKYIEDRVLEPFDFIVADHATLDSEMVKDGLDPQIYWNLWRLTPAVFKTESGEWLVKNEPDKLSSDSAPNNSMYVLENTISLIHQRERKRRGVRSPTYAKWRLRIRNPTANVYRKATRQSQVLSTLPSTIDHVDVHSGTPGLNNDGNYWRIMRSEEMEGDGWMTGYIHEDDLAFD